MGTRDYESLIFLLIILLAACLGNTLLPAWIGSVNYLYYVKPLSWLILSLYIWNKPRTRFKGKLRTYNHIILWSTICGLLYLALFFGVGFMDGIGKSPYARSIQGIIANVVCFGSVLVMMEWVRDYIINRVKKKYIMVFMVITVIVFSLYWMNLRVVTNLRDWRYAVQYLGEYALPEISKNILLTFMVYVGGAYPAIMYTTLTSIPVWIMPVLPDLEWITRAFVGIFSPLVFLVVMKQSYLKRTRELKIREQKDDKPYTWIVTSLISILIIWFAVGVFPLFPTVILTGSMKPFLNPGDLAIMQKTRGDNMEIGDVIQYWTWEYFVIHRIVNIDNNERKYQTKGDNNSVPDSKLVGTEQIRGKLIAVVPKVGILTILLRSPGQEREIEAEF